MNLDFDIAFVAPCPYGDRVKEGWMSRIAAVDAIFRDRRRVYLHFGAHHRLEDGDVVHEHGKGLHEWCLNPAEPAHRAIVDALTERIGLLYVHTIHLAEGVLPWLETGKLVVDFHGVVPEEEAMLGRPELAPRYELVEKEVLAKAKACVMVTDAMREHYAEKYPQLPPRRHVILPIVEALAAEPRVQSDDAALVRVVYAGGTQAWQNVGAMLSLAQSTKEFAHVAFFSHDHEILARQASERGMTGEASFAFVNKHELGAHYARLDFGLVLRDDSPVNRVSCPTKVFEYLQCGVIPIVRSPRLGDFEAMGYAYVTEDEFAGGFFPDAASRAWMSEDNRKVAERMRARFARGANALLDLLKETLA